MKPTSPGGVMLILIVAAALIVGVVWFGFRSHSPPPSDDRTDSTPVQAPIPPLPHSPYRNTTPDVGYVGSERCASCHAEETDSYHETRHSHSLTTAAAMPPRPDAEVPAPKSGYAYRVNSNEGRMTHTESVQLRDGSLYPGFEGEVVYAVGSGAFGHSYVMKRDGYFIQSPVSWYSGRNRWDLSVGYDGADQPSFRRVITTECFFCHAGHLRPDRSSPSKFDVVETAIGCERCHGPGELHVAKYENLKSSASESADDTIVNPSRLSRELAESVCQQCHLQGKAQIPVRGREPSEYRPGLPLDAFRCDIVEEGQSGMSIAGHVQQLHASNCYTKSDSLTCTTCHDPHHRNSSGERPAQMRNICLSCHADRGCRIPEEQRIREADNRCVKCHMPEAPIEVSHVAFTHHRIGIHDSTKSPRSGESTGRLIPFLATQPVSAADDSRARGLAAQRAATSASSPQVGLPLLHRGRALLERAWNEGAGDAAVAVGLAESSFDLQLPSQAIKWAKVALELQPPDINDQIVANRILAELYFDAGRLEESLKAYDALALLRNDARDWLIRGMCELRLNRTDAGMASLQKSLALSPRQPDIHQMLASIYRSQGDSVREQEHLRLATQME